LKRKTSPEDNKNKVMPFEALGSCLYHYGTVFPEDSALGIIYIYILERERLYIGATNLTKIKKNTF
jgi:hypothetical protein